jgi:hypothetical protein
VEMRMEMPFTEYIQKCINLLESMGDKGFLHGIGELMDQEMKNFVRTKLRAEAINLMKFYKEYPIFS